MTCKQACTTCTPEGDIILTRLHGKNICFLLWGLGGETKRQSGQRRSSLFYAEIATSFSRSCFPCDLCFPYPLVSCPSELYSSFKALLPALPPIYLCDSFSFLSGPKKFHMFLYFWCFSYDLFAFSSNCECLEGPCTV